MKKVEGIESNHMKPRRKCLRVPEKQGFGAQKGNETPPVSEQNRKRTGKKTCKIMEQAENHKNSPRWSWATTHMGISGRKNVLMHDGRYCGTRVRPVSAFMFSNKALQPTAVGGSGYPFESPVLRRHCPAVVELGR